MTGKQKSFIDAYLGEARGNASEAARIAGYALPAQQAHENLRKPEIRAAIDAFLTVHAKSAAEVLNLLTQHSNASLAPFLSIGRNDVSIDLTSEEAQANLHLLRKVKCKKRSGGKDASAWEETEIEIEIHDPQAAAVHLGRYHKLFTDRQIQEGDPQKPVVVKVLNNLSIVALK